MGSMHEMLLANMAIERTRLSRRSIVTRSLAVAGGGALVLTLGNRVAFAQSTPTADAPFADDLEVLNYALTLEHLEAAFYRDGIALYSAYGTDIFGLSTDENLAAIAQHEVDHVDTLTKVITDLGGEPVAEGAYNFADAYASAEAFLATAAAVENLGVQAYDGAGQYISNPDLLAAAGSIVAVEARHAAYLNAITGAMPFPAAFETPLAPAEVLAAAGPFLA